MKLADHKEQPELTIVGHGANTFLWIGEGSHCFSFSRHDPKQLYDFAQALIRRVMAPYRKVEKQ